MSDPLPAITIGGYLGSGKTTLLNHLLRHADGRRLAILVNEFGELPIDADLIEAEEDGLISIAGGCVCCSFGNDLLAALRDLSQMQPRPDYVIIESSGVAIPGAITASVALLDGVRPDGTIVVVDAETVRKAARDDYIGDTITRQLADAEIVVINKLDLVDEATASDLLQWLATMAPGAAQLPARFGQVAPETIFGAVTTPGTGHKSPHSDALFDSFVLTPSTPVDAQALAKTLAAGGYGIIRAKGHVTGKDKRSWLIQVVGKRWQADPATGTCATGIVCIGLHDQLATDDLRKSVT
ncbi:GTP-binding protein [Alisedimentitalea sp. MJ-SS2]|uniref:CobW family GTP-binding protein n=1 Tax=Aliisedimentitalea sp. MJ-SS2 TaxID=3049795 RepID=UPI00290FEEE1|nr:GTP-binding protein [Alisedimentitalea sp. MJ-SS2]MDU8925856.1 GTP-binding protein [Alisedimentitalea sp. MJ-SS2]